MRAWRVFEDGKVLGDVLPNVDADEALDAWIDRLGFTESTRRAQCVGSSDVGFVIFERQAEPDSPPVLERDEFLVIWYDGSHPTHFRVVNAVALLRLQALLLPIIQGTEVCATATRAQELVVEFRRAVEQARVA